jgi:hypothetical protein
MFSVKYFVKHKFHNLGVGKMITFENERGLVLTEIISKSEKTVKRKITVHDKELDIKWECIQPVSLKADGSFKHMPIKHFALLNQNHPDGTTAKTPKSYYDLVDSWEAFRDSLWYPYFNEVDSKLFSESLND